jgi:hypothetical protein
MFYLSNSDIRQWFARRAKGKTLCRDSLEFVFTDHRQHRRLEQLASAMQGGNFDCDPLEYDGDGEAYIKVHSLFALDEAGLLTMNSNFREMAGKYRVKYLGVRIAG